MKNSIGVKKLPTDTKCKSLLYTIGFAKRICLHLRLVKVIWCRKATLSNLRKPEKQ